MSKVVAEFILDRQFEKLAEPEQLVGISRPARFALSSLSGAVPGLIAGGGKDPKALLHGAVGGLVGGSIGNLGGILLALGIREMQDEKAREGAMEWVNPLMAGSSILGGSLGGWYSASRYAKARDAKKKKSKAKRQKQQ